MQPDWSYVNHEILMNKACGPRSCGTRVATHTESFVFQSQSSFGNRMDNDFIVSQPSQTIKGYDTFNVSIAMKITVHFPNVTYYLCFMPFDFKVIIMPTTQRAGWFASNTLEHSFSSARQTVYSVRGLLLAILAKKSVHCRRDPAP